MDITDNYENSLNRLMDDLENETSFDDQDILTIADGERHGTASSSANLFGRHGGALPHNASDEHDLNDMLSSFNLN
jgi:hypothetical protein